MIVKIKKLHPSVPTPAYQTAGSAGCDVCAAEIGVVHPGKP